MISGKLLRQLFVLAIIIILFIIISSKLLPYLSGFLGAITLYVLFRKQYAKLIEKKWNKNLAISTIIIGSFFGILIPIGSIIFMLSSKIDFIVKSIKELRTTAIEKMKSLEYEFGFTIPEIDDKSLSETISSSISGLLGGAFDTFLSLTIMYFLLYFMLYHNNRLKSILYSYVPFRDKSLNLISKESFNVVKSNAVGIPLVALCQGIVALIGFLIFGVENPLFWGVITTISSVIPFVGTALGVIPPIAFLLIGGNQWEAIALGIYSLVVVASTDNILRIFILKKLNGEHPLITLFGVIVGVPIFGFIGLIFGPLLISLFLLIVRIYKNEYTEDA